MEHSCWEADIGLLQKKVAGLDQHITYIDKNCAHIFAELTQHATHSDTKHNMLEEELDRVKVVQAQIASVQEDIAKPVDSLSSQVCHCVPKTEVERVLEEADHVVAWEEGEVKGCGSPEDPIDLDYEDDLPVHSPQEEQLPSLGGSYLGLEEDLGGSTKENDVPGMLPFLFTICAKLKEAFLVPMKVNVLIPIEEEYLLIPMAPLSSFVQERQLCHQVCCQ